MRRPFIAVTRRRLTGSGMSYGHKRRRNANCTPRRRISVPRLRRRGYHRVRPPGNGDEDAGWWLPASLPNWPPAGRTSAAAGQPPRGSTEQVRRPGTTRSWRQMATGEAKDIQAAGVFNAQVRLHVSQFNVLPKSPASCSLSPWPTTSCVGRR